ncbi:hypothetical protein F5Y18DRAFT_383001 [Xylariaceae sp. FL1019]|nr:hypothetical protein F5Y18DRAFT_383001 [Xylariaceae sp. FL1019]
MIWEYALAEELKRRRFSVHDTRIIPLKHLNSALLSVCTSSRSCALKQYDTAIVVYRVPSPKPYKDVFDAYINYLRWSKQYFVSRNLNTSAASIHDDAYHEYWQADENHRYIDFSDVYQYMFSFSTCDIIQDIGGGDTTSGILHISTKYDTFGFSGMADTEHNDFYYEPASFLEPFWFEAATKIRDKYDGHEKPNCSSSWQYITAQLEPPVFQALQNVVSTQNCPFSDSPATTYPKFSHLQHFRLNLETQRYRNAYGIEMLHRIIPERSARGVRMLGP